MFVIEDANFNAQSVALPVDLGKGKKDKKRENRLNLEAVFRVDSSCDERRGESGASR